jgi:copper(I)-binding protein
MKKTPDIVIENIWSRPAVVLDDKIGGMGVVYLTIVNKGSKPDRLISAKSVVSNELEMHTTIMVDGRVQMQQLKDGIEIPGNASVNFEPGGSHMMLIGLKRNLRQGDRFEVTFTFEKSGTLTLESEVR